jgi:prevent-host-death family protein
MVWGKRCWPPERLTIAMCYTIVGYMKTATVRDLRNNYLQLIKWLAAGEHIIITRRGRPIARLTPESSPESTLADWSQSATVTRDRTQETCLSPEESGQLLRDSSGRW